MRKASKPKEEKSRAGGGVGPARDAACKAVTGMARAYPELREAVVKDKGLSPSDAALAHAIVRTCVVRWVTLAMLCERALRRGWDTLDAPVQGALLVGAAQILFFDRVPRHAAVDESVAWTKSQASGAAPLVNAGLRELCRLAYGMGTEHDTETGRRIIDALDPASRRQIPLADGRVLELCQEALPLDQTRRFALQAGTPLALFNGWMREYGPARAREIALHGLVDAPICVHVAGEPGIQDALLARHDEEQVRVFVGSIEQLREFLKAHPRVWVQDASATRAVRGVADRSPKVVVDLCAGQGTKTKHLAVAFPDAVVLASDPDEERAKALAEVPAAFANVKVVADAELTARVHEASGGRGADLILLDVPCSNTGVLPRRPEAMHRPRTEQLRRLSVIQREILTRSAAMLAPGGEILYSTCSIDRDENQTQAAWACEALGLVLVREELTLPQGVPGEAASRYHDGAYHAVLRRR